MNEPNVPNKQTLFLVEDEEDTAILLTSMMKEDYDLRQGRHPIGDIPC